MERRLLLVFALTFLVIIVFQPVLKKYLPQPPTQPPASTATQNQNSVPSPPAGNPPNVTQSQPSSHEKTIKATAESDFVVENDLYKITFTNGGGQVKSWILKKYDDEKGRPLDLVNAVAAEKYGYPLSLWAYDEALRNKINSALYVTSSFGQQEAPAEITFDYSDTDVEVHKTFRFDHTYVVRVEASVLAKGSAIGAFPMWPAGFGDQATPASYASSTVDYQFNGSIERLSAKKVSSGNTIKGPFNLAGVADQYFAAVFIPEDPQNAATVTLRITQMKSALKMQRVAPQIKAIQEKYKKYSMRDPRKQEMNKEVADLYKKEGVNPVGGCLPLIIQMPFLFAYYSMLQAALDLRHAHWLWIPDLSARDPWFVLPIALVVSMVATQRMTPQPSMDPAQQKMMNVMMPLMMGFIFFNLASGLNLYYSESNLISIIQQAIMNRTKVGREMREMAQKRARKKDK